ncbi:MAG: lytic transglycosylase domain-containing protein [Thermodesulfobacteriota bacterium]|nr:lytic transglycosylase domain-containing protein [Thermodesulfobacteriota bacterium]
MPFGKTLQRVATGLPVSLLLVGFSLISAPVARAEYSLLKNIIVAWNLERYERSLSDGSYRGEKGILRIRPEVARSFGLSVPIDQDYVNAVNLFRQADESHGKAVQAMADQDKERFPGEHVEAVAESALQYNELMRSGRESLTAYRSRLMQTADERLDEKICSHLLEKLLAGCFETASYNLRDGLACFYNRCQDVDEDNWPLNPVNVRFVNHVFREFMEKASDQERKRFDFDKHFSDGRANPNPGWRKAMGGGARYLEILETVIGARRQTGYCIDPLLFVALIRQESKFNPRAVSHVGAAGLTQIMPETAKGLGMKSIFEPAYLHEARSLMGSGRKLRAGAIALIPEMNKENSLGYAGRARRLMQESRNCKSKGRDLYAAYKKDLLMDGTDDRLDQRKAIEYGFKYFGAMMKTQDGDMSLALASYNAGPRRIRQYKGIPPYPETISFRNRVLGYYREYLRRAEK